METGCPAVHDPGSSRAAGKDHKGRAELEDLPALMSQPQRGDHGQPQGGPRARQERGRGARAAIGGPGGGGTGKGQTAISSSWAWLCSWAAQSRSNGRKCPRLLGSVPWVWTTQRCEETAPCWQGREKLPAVCQGWRLSLHQLDAVSFLCTDTQPPC